MLPLPCKLLEHLADGVQQRLVGLERDVAAVGTDRDSSNRTLVILVSGWLSAIGVESAQVEQRGVEFAALELAQQSRCGPAPGG